MTVGKLYEDIDLSPAQVRAVRDYVHEVDFHLPGASSEDFQIGSRARYLGYDFQEEDLEAYGVGLQCIRPGMQHLRTFIRMHRDQLLAADKPIGTEPRRLPVNDPVLAHEAMLMHRFRDHSAGPLPTGPDVYEKDPGLVGGDLDLDMLEKTLEDIRDFHSGRPVFAHQEVLDLRVNWGTLLAGRYQRLKHFQYRGALSEEQEQRLVRLEQAVTDAAPILEEHALATLESLRTPVVVDG